MNQTTSEFHANGQAQCAYPLALYWMAGIKGYDQTAAVSDGYSKDPGQHFDKRESFDCITPLIHGSGRRHNDRGQ
jgi:hypothetical protein